jgi:hypothetical protein
MAFRAELEDNANAADNQRTSGDKPMRVLTNADAKHIVSCQLSVVSCKSHDEQPTTEY